MDYLYKDKKKSLTKMKKQQDKKGSHFLSGLGSFSYSSIKKLLWALMFFIFLYVFLIVVSPAPLREHQRLIPNEKLTIVMNTFKRHDLMEEAIDHYSKCNIVKYVYVVWSEPDPPTDAMISKFSSRSHPWVIFDIHKQDSLNNRFKPLPNPHTDSIFAVDDDMRVSCDDLALGYEVWRNSQRNLVGYMPRIHLRRSDGSLVYRCWWRVWWHGVYSIILTKAAFLHHDYLREYTENMPAQIRELVDQKRNCEDIAMQFLVANISSLPPIYVKGSLDDLGALNGISTSKSVVGAGHMDQRSQCLNDLVSIYGRNPLITSHTIVDSSHNGWVNRPSTWYEYISSDLWKFT